MRCLKVKNNVSNVLRTIGATSARMNLLTNHHCIILELTFALCISCPAQSFATERQSKITDIIGQQKYIAEVRTMGPKNNRINDAIDDSTVQ